ncbi:hypothetical protein GCM10009547_09090 [Sporichthya brevicatena]|uniref:Uncharacterized protein n=1 Tax=Sporichthya brevicatena TaxID=171442 RepID=A0ABN1GDG7_9ACTN
MFGFPLSHERLAHDISSLEHALGAETPLRNLSMTRRAHRFLNRYGRGARVQLPAEFVRPGAAPQRGRLSLTQRQATPSWSVGRFRDRSPAPVTIHPGPPTPAPAGESDKLVSLAWRARVGETEGQIVVPAEFGIAFAAHLTVRP